jgi:hypothetical protein
MVHCSALLRRLVCIWGTNCGIYGVQSYVCMRRSVVETIISGGALWAIMMANYTLELLKMVEFWETLRQLWQTS